MDRPTLTDADKERASQLARELKRKLELYFPEPPQDERIAEVAAIREELKKMGFLVTWGITLNVETVECVAEVTLYLRKPSNVLPFPQPTP